MNEAATCAESEGPYAGDISPAFYPPSRFAAFSIRWFNPRAASEQEERMSSVIIDRQR